MGDTSGAKYKHIRYNPSRASPKSGKKPQKALQRHADLMKKQEKHGETKWIKNAMVKCKSRLKKYGLTHKMHDQKFGRKKD